MPAQNVIVKPSFEMLVNVTFNTDLTDRIKIEEFSTGQQVALIQNKPWVFGELNETNTFGNGTWKSPKNNTNQIKVYVISGETARGLSWFPMPLSILFGDEFNVMIGFQDQEGGSYSSAGANVSLDNPPPGT
jgi:hypothetical protein